MLKGLDGAGGGAPGITFYPVCFLLQSFHSFKSRPMFKKSSNLPLHGVLIGRAHEGAFWQDGKVPDWGGSIKIGTNQINFVVL